MRIALVASLVAPIKTAEANGPHAVILDLARGLAQRGHATTIYAAAGTSVDGVEVHEVPVDPIARGAAIRADGGAPTAAGPALERGFAELYRRLRRDGPDVISQHAFDAPAIELAEGLPVLHTLHLPPVADDVVAAARATSAPLVTVSDACRTDWLRAGVNDIGVLRNGVPRRAPSAGAVEPVTLIAGRISPEKGTHVAVRVARRAGLRPLVVGDAYDGEYFARAVEPLLWPTEFIGPVPRDRLFELMARSAVLLMPVDWNEPFGLVAAEAQMAGCPVVAYRRGALPEVVADGVGGYLVEPDDESALVAACRRALLLDRACLHVRAWRVLGVEAMVDAYEAVLARVASVKPPRAGRRSVGRRSAIAVAAGQRE